MLRLHVAHGAHPSVLRRWFPAPDPDPYFEEAVLVTLYGPCWTSVLVEQDGHALRHAFAASAIASTGLFDIEPLVGYAGPLATPDAPHEFLIEALRRYSAFCREHGIVAELVRFNPILENHGRVDGLLTDLAVPDAKPVVYLPCTGDLEAMSRYTPAARRNTRTGYRSSLVSVLPMTSETWEEFRSLYDANLDAVGAGREWRLDDGLWARLHRDCRLVLVGAVQAARLVAAAVVLAHHDTWYYLLAANVRDPDTRRGASNAVVHEITRVAAQHGARRLGLGGGNSTSPADSLLRFKRSFGGDLRPFRIGLFTHDRVALQALVRGAEREAEQVRASSLFLRYRLAPSCAAGRMRPVPLRSVTAELA